MLVLPSGGGGGDDDDGAAVVPPKLNALPGVSRPGGLAPPAPARAIAGRRLISRCDREPEGGAAVSRGEHAASLPPLGSGGGLVPGRPRSCYVVVAT